MQGYTQGQQYFEPKKIVKFQEKDQEVNINYFLQAKEEQKKA